MISHFSILIPYSLAGWETRTTRLLKLAEVFDFSNTHWVESVQSAQDPGKVIRKRIRILRASGSGCGRRGRYGLQVDNTIEQVLGFG